MDQLRELIKTIYNYGVLNKVPIMSEDTIETINNIINKKNIHSILEIGTAIAYSTICFASNKNIDRIVSIERDDNRYEKALQNVKESCLNNITLIHDDAFNVNINDKFDLIIIDAAKSQNMKFLDKFKLNLSSDGIVIIDNLDFHGYVGKSSEIKSRNLRQMVRKIEKFIDYLDNNEEFDVEYVKVGDTIGICKRKNL